MKSVAVSDIKASLSRYISSVKGGNEIIITDRGKAVAKLVPVDREEELLPAHLIELERAGLAVIGTQKIPPLFWKRKRPLDAAGKALAALKEERESGR